MTRSAADYPDAMAATRAAGSLAAAVSALLLVVVVVRDVGLNAANGWTIALGSLAAALLLGGGRDRAALVGACIALLAAMVPALIGGMGLLYVPSLLLATSAVRRASASPRTA